MAAVSNGNLKRKVQKSKEYQTLENLCQQNQVNIKTLKTDGDKISTLQMFFGGYPDLIGLRFFPSLTKLVLVGQDISNIGNIKYIAATLNELWICESKLKKLDGLEKCVKLKALYLYDNFIEDAAQISLLTDLDVVWLNNNKISSLEFLEKLFSLKDLNMANNCITDYSLRMLKIWPRYISNINFSGNNIMELKSLTKLTLYNYNITTLCFDHPTFGKCPISDNPFYIPWIFYHFTSLMFFDGLETKPDNPAKLIATKLKYEVETRLRAIDDECYVCQIDVNCNFKKYHDTVCERIQILSKAATEKAKVSKISGNSKIFDQRKQYWLQNLNILQTLKSNVLETFKVVADLKHLKTHLMLENCQINSNLSEFIAEELETISEKLRDHFCAEQMAPFGITHVKLRDFVTFDRILDFQEIFTNNLNIYFPLIDQPITSDFIRTISNNVHLLDDTNFVQNYHQFVKYFENSREIFCVLPILVIRASENCNKTLAKSEDFSKITDNDNVNDKKQTKRPKKTICSCDKNFRLHLNDKIRLSGDYEFIGVILAEFERTTYCWNYDNLVRKGNSSSELAEQIENDETILGDISKFSTLIKFNLDDYENFDNSLTTLNISANALSDLSPLNNLTKLINLDVSFNRLENLTTLNSAQKLETLNLAGNSLNSWSATIDYLKFYCTKLKTLDLRCNLWSLEEEYKCEIYARGYLLNLVEINGKEAEDLEYPLIFEQIPDDRYRNRLFNIFELPNFLNAEKWPNLLKRFGYEPIKAELLEQSDNKWFECITAMNCENLNLLNLQKFDEIPTLKYFIVNGNLLGDLSGLTSLTQLKVLHLDSCYIEKMPILRHLTNLNELSLRFNGLTDMGFCKDVPQLRKLDVTGNRIDSLEDVHFLNQLNEIFIARNLIANIHDVKTLKNIKNLKVVDFTGNEIQQTVNYRLHSIYLLKFVMVLDLSLVSEEERYLAEETFGHTLNLDFLSSRFDPNNLLHLTELSLTKLGLQSASLPEDNYLANLKSIDLSQNKFKYIAELSNLRNLECLILTGNCVQKIVQIDIVSDELNSSYKIFKRLKLLHLDLNSICKLQPFQFRYLSDNLTELYLQNNKLANVQNLDSLSGLEILDLSNNKIALISANSFAGLRNLKILRLAYNKLKELAYLSDLVCLENLDISFNMIQSCKNLKDLDKLKRLSNFRCVGNAVCKRNVYEHFVISHLPHLHNMDEKVITPDDRVQSASTMLNLKKTVSTTNLLHHSFNESAGDEDE